MHTVFFLADLILWIRYPRKEQLGDIRAGFYRPDAHLVAQPTVFNALTLTGEIYQLASFFFDLPTDFGGTKRAPA